MKKLLIFSYYWPPSGGAGVQRWLKMSKYLPQFGIEPIIITVDENKTTYPQLDESLLQEVDKNLRVFKTNTIEPFNAYKKFTGEKQLPYGGFANQEKQSFKKELSTWIRGNFFVPDPRRAWNTFAIKQAVQIIEKEEIEAFITTSPPHSSQLIGLSLKNKFPHLKWICDLRDPWTDIYYYAKLKRSAAAKWLDANYEKQVLLKADQIIVVSDAMKRLYEEKYKLENKIEVIYNAFDEKDFDRSLKSTNSVFTITYTGTLSSEYPVDGLLKALAMLSFDFCIQFVGKVDAEIAEKFKQSLGAKVKFLPFVPHLQSVQYLQHSNLLLLIIPNASNNKGILTGKLFEYIGAAKPILCLGPINGDAANIVNQQVDSQAFTYNESEQILQFIRQQFSNFQLGKSARIKDFSSPYSREKQAAKVAALIS